MPSILKVPLPVQRAISPSRFFEDWLEFNSFWSYRTLATSFPTNNGFESNHFGAIKAIYRNQAKKLEESELNKPDQVNWLVEKLPLNQDSVVLDLNCGTGLVSRSIGTKVKQIHGTDISRHLVNFAKTKPAENIDFHLAEAAQLPFEDNTFDVVFSRMSLNHIAHRDEVIEELRRVCKPGGHIALMERVIPSVASDDAALRMEYIEGIRDPAHVYFMTASEMAQLFADNDIEVTTKEVTSCPESLDAYLNQTDVNQHDRACISQYIFGNMIAPDPEYNQLTGFFPHLRDDVVNITHHFALIGGKNPAEKPKKE
mmetsp:Transcript_61054/g.92303  ORF Transcript_61054/g.92303 Transcript_61054/m.92303 type:complete len:313 (-) Transcript_61054:94-1032(-)